MAGDKTKIDFAEKGLEITRSQGSKALIGICLSIKHCLDGNKLGNVWSASIPTYFTKLYAGDNFCAYLVFTPSYVGDSKIQTFTESSKAGSTMVETHSAETAEPVCSLEIAVYGGWIIGAG